jgi:hypothetical protein
MPRRARYRHLSLAALALAGAFAPGVHAQQSATPDWEEAFRHPPAAARPHVWWHWMNGNVDAEGARRDLAWMASVGIAEAHIFEGGMGTPTVVPQRRPFMSPGWQEALKASADAAAHLGMTLGLATSPGWSATGGPWVAPGDAMKKLVWSRTEIAGGQHVHQTLPQPPAVAGPYQDVPLSLLTPGEKDGPHFYRDSRVLAWPVTGEALPQPRITVSGGATLQAPALSNGHFADGQSVPLVDGAAWVVYSFDTPQTLRSATVGLPAPSGFGMPNPPLARLEVSDDGQSWRKLADLPPTPAPALAMPMRSASFAPVTTRHIRLLLTPDPAPAFADQFTFAPGAVKPPFAGPPPKAFQLSEFTLSAQPQVSRAAEKAGFSTLGDYDAAADGPAQGVDPAGVIDISAHMAPDGTLDWTPPPGRWQVLRMGFSLTGHQNGPAPEEATGLEVDKLSAPRVSAYLDHYLGLYRAALGAKAFGPGGLTSLLSDSIEAGPQNWTETLPETFAQRRGYDPTPWLPALTGQIIGDTRRTEAFLHDWRQTIAELYADAHYGTIAKAAHANHLTYSAEALEDHRPQLGDDMAMRARADVPMGAMWTVDSGTKPSPTYVADLKGAASVAHLYGKPVVAAESMSAFGRPWAFAPVDLKPTVDLEFALGVNRIHIHESAHQPLADAAPGLALATFLGQYFNRNETWAPLADGWISYLARSSALLQQGLHSADIAYFYGEEAPLTSLYGDHPLGDVPKGYDYDFVNAEALATRLSVKDGRLVTADGQSYRLLMLGGDSARMTLPTLHHLRDLLAAGATVVGKRPAGSPSLADDPAQVSALVDQLWGDGQHGPVAGLYADLPSALEASGLAPDWRWDAAGDLAVLHRKGAKGDLWFVSNRAGKAISGTLDLRITGRLPELWHADTGRIEPVSYRMAQGRTLIPLTLPRDEAIFVVFRKPTAVAARTVPAASPRVIAQMADGWQRSFQARRGAPEGTHPAALGDWSKEADPGIRYFSGLATYNRDLPLPKGWHAPKGRVEIDLGEVRDVADVAINGQRAGVAWKPPYRVDITGLLHAGTNRVTVRVANLWVNRLIGDQQKGATRIAVVTGPTYQADAPLRPSGLLGPVTVIATGR